MNILQHLSTQCGDKSEASNHTVAALCLEQPPLLEQIAGGLQSGDAALMGDCAEVMTMTAEKQPALVQPYASLLATFIRHPNTRVRWECLHALELVASQVPGVIENLMPGLPEQYESDASVIVRDQIIKLAGNYAGCSAAAAQQVYPLLKRALYAWEGKQAKLALNGLQQVLEHLPRLGPEISALNAPFLQHERTVVRKAALSLKKKLPGEDSAKQG